MHCVEVLSHFASTNNKPPAYRSKKHFEGNETMSKSEYEISPEMIDAGARALISLLPEEYSLSSAEYFAEAAIAAL